MENLTKQQIVLVTLLVSFVTSIATGIVTVALMQQAPPGMVQTINRVVERTVEKVVQTPAQNAAVVTKETVVVKEDDLVVSAIDKNSPSLVRFISDGGDTRSPTLALGLVLTKDGLIAADAQRAEQYGHYAVRLADDKIYPVEFVYTDAARTAIFRIHPADGEKLSLNIPVLADSDTLKLGQAVVYIGGEDRDTVETGLIASLKRAPSKDSQSTTTDPLTEPIIEISTSIRPQENKGGILVNLSGEVVGLQTSASEGLFLPSNTISEALSGYSATTKTEQSPRP